MRVLSLATVFPNPLEPSAGTFVKARLAGLAAAGAEVTVVAPLALLDYAGRRMGLRRPVPRVTHEGRLAIHYPRWIYPPKIAALNPFLLAFELLPLVSQLMRHWQPHVIDAHFGFPEGVTAWILSRLVRRPFVVTLRGNEPLHAGYPLRRLLMKRSFAAASALIAVSERLAAFARELCSGTELVTVVPNGVDTSLFYPRERAQCRRRWEIRPEEHLVISVGSLIPRKGHHWVIRAIRQLIECGLQVKLIVAGGRGREGDVSAQLLREVRQHGLQSCVRFAGVLSQDALADLYSAADLLCLASTREGHPNVVQEALACGCPVVMTDVGAARALIPSAEYGVVVPLEQLDHLSQVLSEALRRSWNREQIAAWGRKRSWEEVGREVIKVLQVAAQAQ